MGGVKQYQLEMESLGLAGTKDTRVCSAHIADYAIKDFIKNNSTKGKCDYCKKSRKVVSLELLLPFMMKGIMHFYRDAAEWMSYNSREGGYQGDTYTPNELINDELGLDIDNYQLQLDIVDCIDGRAWSNPDGYWDTQRDILIYHWNYFKEVVKHKSRYLFGQVKKFRSDDYQLYPYDILLELEQKVQQLDLFTTIPRGTDIFRCRQHAAKDIVNVAEDMAAPPLKYAVFSNRMSPAGISMFYGGFDRQTTILETVDSTQKIARPLFTTAAFATKKDLRVIDFTVLPYIPSVFDLKRYPLYYTISFLRDFVHDLSAGVARDGKEHIDYVPTQIVTEYFRFIFEEHTKQKLDGIIYSSSKHLGKKACVLFMDHEESLERLNFKPNTLKLETV